MCEQNDKISLDKEINNGDKDDQKSEKIKNGKKYYFSDYDCLENNSDIGALAPNNPGDRRNFIVCDLLKLDFIFTRRNLRFKRIMRIVYSIFAMGLIIALTVLLVLFLCNLKNIGIIKDGSQIAEANVSINDGSEVGAVASIVGSLVAYASSVIMIFKIIIQYIFNKEEDKERTNLISKILQFDQGGDNEKIDYDSVSKKEKAIGVGKNVLEEVEEVEED